MAPISRTARLLMVLPFASALFVLVVFVQFTGGFAAGVWSGERLEIHGLRDIVLGSAGVVAQGLFLPALMAYNQLSSLALLAVIVLTAEHRVKGMAAVVVGCVVHTVLLVTVLLDTVTSDSSTASIGLFFIPVYQLALIALVALTAYLVHEFRTRARIPR